MRSAATLLLAACLLACGSAEEEPARYAAPARSRVLLVLEPPVVAVGDVADLELAVVTTPGHAVKPFDVPGKVDGFWLVERVPLEVVKEPARWVHRTLLRLRAVEVGRFEFPGGSVLVESPDGETAQLEYASLPLEVVSVVPEHPTQQSPYGIRTLALETPGGPGSVVAFVAGALLGLASAGVLLLVRRRLAAQAARVASAPDPAPAAWSLARKGLARAREIAGADPRRAADLAAATLREYAVRRFGGDATVRTTQELGGAKPPFTLTTRWPRFLEMLRGLDALRFPAPSPAPDRVLELVAKVADFVEETVPAESRE